jgi:hypothetical protein
MTDTSSNGMKNSLKISMTCTLHASFQLLVRSSQGLFGNLILKLHNNEYEGFS